MRTKLIVAIGLAVVVLLAGLVVFVTQRNNQISDASLKLQPLQTWTDELLIQASEVPHGWEAQDIQTKSDLGTAARWLYFKNPAATDISFINFHEALVPYRNIETAINNYQRWIDLTIPPAYDSEWKQTPELDFPHHADQMKIRCLSGEVNFISHRVCVAIAQYQNLILVAGGIVYDKWLPASDFRQILLAMDQRIARVLSTQAANPGPAQVMDNDALPLAMPTPTAWSGGTRILLTAASCPTTAVADQMIATSKIIEARLNDAGLYDAFVQIIDCQIKVIVPPPDVEQQTLIDLIQQSGHFELAATGSEYYPAGSVIRTTGIPSPTVPLSPSLQATIPDTVYETIVTGADFDTDKLQVSTTSNNSVQLSFTLKGAAVKTFAQFTAAHNSATNGGEYYYICIVFDSIVQSCPAVQSEIPNGQGVVTVGAGGVKEANHLLNIFRSGALPLKLQVVKIDTIR